MNLKLCSLLVLSLAIFACGCTDDSSYNATPVTNDVQHNSTNPPNEPSGGNSNVPNNNPDQNLTMECRPAPDAEHPELVTDEDWARAMIAGQVSADKAFPVIAYSCGFPVITDDDTIIFAHWYTGGSWALAGDLNNWTPEAMKTTPNGDVWYIEHRQPNNLTTANGYKFMNNGSQYQADPWALRYNYDDNGELSYLTKPAGQHIMRWNNFKSPQGLKSRALHVLVPPNDGPYDVLYAHDGQNIYQTDGYSGGWRLREVMNEIHGNFLIVGISNTEDRMYEYTHVDDTAFGEFYPSKGRAYAAFVEESVRPFIESKFRTTNKAGVMGSSLGGLISLYIAHLYPNRYRAVLALSPTTAWGRFGSDNGIIMRQLYEEAGHRNTYLYLDNGGVEPDGGCGANLGQFEAERDESGGADTHDNYCYTRDFVDAMERIGYRFEVDLTHWHEPGATHTNPAWAARVFRPLSIFKNL